MSTPRVIMHASVVAVSRPGYDVLTAPRTSDYMAFDSAIPIERALVAGILYNAAPHSLPAPTVYYGRTFAIAPTVSIHPIAAGGVIYEEMIRYLQDGSSEIWQSSYACECATGYFKLLKPGGGLHDSWGDVARNWSYCAWKVA